MLITAKSAKSTMEEAKSARKEEFLKLFYEGGYADKFNIAVETQARKGEDRAMIEYPKGYYTETVAYLEEELGYVTVSGHRSGIIYVAWF